VYFSLGYDQIKTTDDDDDNDDADDQTRGDGFDCEQNVYKRYIYQALFSGLV